MPKLQSVMQHNFATVPTVSMPRSVFNRSHGHKTTFDAGYLIPILVDEALPGDTFNCRMAGFGRLATPIYPIMDNLRLDTQFFAVPYRLVWENWERFMGSQDNPGDSIDYLVPTVTTPGGGFSVGSLYDYFGIPTDVDFSAPDSVDVNNLHARCYNLIWNEWYRDQNLQDSVVVDVDDGPDDSADYVLLRRGKRPDYFTTCLPWPQKGDAVSIPLGTSAPVDISSTGTFQYNDGGGTIHNVITAGTTTFVTNANAVTSGAVSYNSGLTGTVDLTAATSETINALRLAFQVQKILEKDARGGTRYVEIIKNHFNTVSPDFRMQRPEYLGGGSAIINMSVVPQTSETATTAQGNLAAYGTVSFNGHGFVKSFTEHCLIIGLASVRADLTYMRGIDRMWTRQTRYDYYWPSLAHIGEQAVYSRELYVDGTADDNNVFGYQERYAEYRHKLSLVTGQFRSTAAGSLDAWHLSQDFGVTRPELNAGFIQDNPPIDRVIATPSEPHFIFDSYFDYRCVRPMPVHGVPGMIDHF